MGFISENLSLPDSTFTLLRDLIHEKTGAKYEQDRRDVLADKLSPLVRERGLTSFLDYYYLLKYDEAADEEWQRVMDALSVQETYFWREIDQIKALVDVVVPQHFAAYPDRPLRIWSAGCATGEEPLTIAMVLKEAGWFSHKIEIYATDASPSAIAKAKKGLYRERAFRNLSPILQTTYFRPEQGLWRVSPELHARIQWGAVNLAAASDIKLLPPMSVIFCRNVFIYFSAWAIRQTLKSFFEITIAPGYLFVGASESLLKLTTDFELKDIAGAFVYVNR